jgi:hypothetical protein
MPDSVWGDAFGNASRFRALANNLIDAFPGQRVTMLPLAQADKQGCGRIQFFSMSQPIEQGFCGWFVQINRFLLTTPAFPQNP